MPFTRFNSTLMHWSATGPADRPAIVFSNSLGSDWRIWNAVTERLSHRYRIVSYDKRGHGLSDVSVQPVTIAALADDMLALADHLKLGRFSIAGISVGGMIAQAVAAKASQRLSALILCDTAAKIGMAGTWNTRINSIRSGGIASIADPIIERWFARGFREARPDDLAGWRNMLTRTPADGYIAMCEAIRDADLTAAAAQIRVPTLLVTGGEDASTPPDLVRGTANLIPGSRFEVIENAGHLPCIEQPEVLAGLISEHLEGAGHV